jgi:hypothetical protein
LHAGVSDEAVDEPGEEGAGGGKAGAGGYYERLEEGGLGELVAFVVRGAEDVV